MENENDNNTRHRSSIRLFQEQSILGRESSCMDLVAYEQQRNTTITRPGVVTTTPMPTATAATTNDSCKEKIFYAYIKIKVKCARFVSIVTTSKNNNNNSSKNGYIGTGPSPSLSSRRLLADSYKWKLVFIIKWIDNRPTVAGDSNIWFYNTASSKHSCEHRPATYHVYK